jgi:hypothetical protein
MPTTTPLPAAPARVLGLLGTLNQVQPMRRGSLSERYMKCGKPGCPCQKDSTARHGPYFTVTRGVGGRTTSRYLDPEQAVVARRQVQAALEFRRQVDALWEACETWADTELDSAAGHPEVAEKGGSKRRSPRRLRPRSPGL